MNYDDYEIEMVKIENESKRLAFDWDQWVVRKITPKVTFYSTNVPYAPNTIYKAETVINCAPRKLLDMVYPDGPYRMKWDPLILHCEPLYKFNKDTMIAYQVVRPQLKGLIKERDTVDLFRTSTTEDYRHCSFASIHYEEDIPFWKQHYVRGWNYPCGIFFVPTENVEQSKVIMVMNFNMGVQVMKMTIKVPEIILEKLIQSKAFEYIRGLEKTETMSWQPLDGLTT